MEAISNPKPQLSAYTTDTIGEMMVAAAEFYTDEPACYVPRIVVSTQRAPRFWCKRKK